MSEFQGKRIVLGVTGGVAAYKAAELVRLLVKAGAEVDVVLTDRRRAQFVGAATFQALTGRRVWQALWDERMDNGMAHIDLTRGAAALLVAPATADFMAKLAHGFADDLLSTLCLARDCPLAGGAGDEPPDVGKPGDPAQRRAVAGRRHQRSWARRTASRPAAKSATDACSKPPIVRRPGHAALQAKPLAGRRVLLTAGPTFEALDPVRGLTNSVPARWALPWRGPVPMPAPR
jgi:phosphopantothenoylcysteine decarboxylase/phosphopantothenate--cysteine ligase